ncbi:RNA polymerase sigma factor [uncultured Tateyamaria sp.]|uniref:RNA polymerase sigma factor n=1 Tax=uncultured Tateyamaria sp. TaxID=455651 RepID=UPI0026315749|nr:RNA polymerase sigma factor [uncultured Tateyamaria sp.]
MTNDPRDELVTHIGPMRAFAISLTRNASLADDMVQDALVKAWSNIDSFQAGTNMRAWLFTILRNTYYSHHRKRRREVEDVEGALSEKLAQKPDHDGRLQMRDFAAAFEELPEDQREALVLVGAGGFSYEEAAQTCGVAVGTIKSRVNRGRAKLVELMGVSDDEPMEVTAAVTQGIVAMNQSIA